MSLGTRLTAARKVVSIYDDALAGIDIIALGTYVTTREIEHLGDLDKLPEKPVVFILEPMTTKTERWEDDPRALVAFCCREINNAPIEWSVEHKVTSGLRHLSDETMDAIPLNVVREMANVIIEMANGDTAPFVPPDGWGVWKARSALARTARSAQSTPARETDSG